MKVNVWYTFRSNCHCFASLSDECNYCYSAEAFTFDEAKVRYERDHAHEHCQYHYIIK